MSGHSKWSTIKRQKAANDQARGKVFSKLSKAISVAVKTGGGPNIDSNYKLKMAVEQAKTANMPKQNIDRAIERASGDGMDMAEIVYEGFGPAGIQVIVDGMTDNKNRTAQELKHIFERHGGSMGSPGSVSFNFEMKGYLLVDNGKPHEEQMLGLIDLGVEDMDDSTDGVEIFVEPSDLVNTKESFAKNGFNVISAEVVKKPVSTVKVDKPEDITKILKLLETLSDHDDVTGVSFNADIEE